MAPKQFRRKVVGQRKVTVFYRGAIRNIVTTKYTEKIYYRGSHERTELVAVLECGHECSMYELNGKDHINCHDCYWGSTPESGSTIASDATSSNPT